MAHTHRTGPELGPGTMGFYIMLCTVHTIQGQGTIVTARNEVAAKYYFHKRVSRILSTGAGGVHGRGRAW